MAGILTYGAGAYSGLEDIMAQALKEQIQARADKQLEETTRHNQATESQSANALALSGRSLDLSDKYRRDNLASLDATRQSEIANKRRDDLERRATLRGAGDPVSPEEYDAETEFGFVPKGRYNEVDHYGILDGPDEQGPTLDREITSKGMVPKVSGAGQTQTKPYKLNGKDIIGQETPTGRVIYQGRDVTDEPGLHPYQAPDRVLVPIQDANGNTTLQHRSGAAGAQAPLSSTERESVHGLDYLDQLMTEAQDMWDSGKSGVGPVQNYLTGPLHDYTGLNVAGGSEGQALRDKINLIRTEASFARGGKQLTPTERKALDEFLASADKNPDVALQRLKEYQASARTRKGAIVSGGQPSTHPQPKSNDPGGLFN